EGLPAAGDAHIARGAILAEVALVLEPCQPVPVSNVYFERRFGRDQCITSCKRVLDQIGRSKRDARVRHAYGGREGAEIVLLAGCGYMSHVEPSFRVSCVRAVVGFEHQTLGPPVAPPPAVGSSHQTVIARDPDRGVRKNPALRSGLSIRRPRFL